VCNDVASDIDAEPTVRGAERFWIAGSIALGPESHTKRYRRRYPMIQIGFFQRYYRCASLSSGRSCSAMAGGTFPLDLVPGHQFPSYRRRNFRAK
jgi:hypothetical protein